jgi:nucleotide-binding universal stress UspA family protein
MRILLAIDDSTFSDAAVDAVIAQFGQRGHEVRVLHAADWERRLPVPYLFAEGAEAARSVLSFRDTLIHEAAERVCRIVERLRAAGFTVEMEIRREGDPRTAILEMADQWPADLIVVGSHGRSGLDRFLLGSVSERVVRHAPCSVEVVRPSTRSHPAAP